MSAFGVVMVALGVLMLWSGIKRQKVNEVLLGFVGKPVQTQAAVHGSGTQVD